MTASMKEEENIREAVPMMQRGHRQTERGRITELEGMLTANFNSQQRMLELTHAQYVQQAKGKKMKGNRNYKRQREIRRRAN